MLLRKCRLTTVGILLAAVLSVLVLPTVVQAHNKVVVIPMAGDDLMPLKNIITVAKENGDFTDPVAAMNSITDASENNPYLIVIAPGVYTLTTTLATKRYVDVTGSGEKITKLIGEVPNGPVVNMSSGTVVRDLTIQNSELGYGVQFFLTSASAKLDHVTILMGGLGQIFGSHTGIRIIRAGATISNATITTSNTLSTFQTAWGVFSDRSSPTIRKLQISIQRNGTEAYGIYSTGVDGSGNATTISDTNIMLGGFSFEPQRSVGIYSDNNAPIINNVTIRANGSISGYGIQHVFPTSSNIRQSWVEGSTFGLLSANAVVSQTSLVGGQNSSGLAITTCVFSDDGEGNALNANCQN